MSPDSRQSRLEALGLTLWQRRGAATPTPSAKPAPAPQAPAEPSPAAEPPAPTDPVPPAPEASEPAAPEPDPVTAEPPEPAVEDDRPAGDDIASLDWDALAAYLARQDHRGASRPVFGVGAHDADLLIVGEAPGAEEDRKGEPFVGRAGKLLDRMLLAIGRSRGEGAYIANICKFRPPNNRDPNADEVAADRPYLERQIELLSPRLIIAVGRVAAQTLLQNDAPLGRMRGRLHQYPGRDIPVLVTYHPAYLLRTPQHKGRAWADLKKAREILEARS